MALPIVLKGTVQGRTIVLDEKSFLPDGYRVTLHLVLDPDEALRLSFGGWADMTPEEVTDCENTLSEFEGRPVKLPDPDPS